MPAKRAASRSTERPSAAFAGRLESWSRLDEDLALAVVSGPASAFKAHMAASLVDDSSRLDVEAVRVGTGHDDETFLLLRSRDRRKRLFGDGRLVLELVVGSTELSPGLVAATVPPDIVARRHLIALPRELRATLLEEIWAGAARLGRDPAACARTLRSVRDVARHHAAAAEMEPASRLALSVDGLYRIDESAFYIEGWLLDRDQTVTDMTVISPEGQRVELLTRVFRYPRHDVSEFFGVSGAERLGFIAYFETRHRSPVDDGWLIQALDASAGGSELLMPPAHEGGVDLRTLILYDLEHERPGDDLLRVEHLAPALARLEARMGAGVTIDVVEQFGAAAEDPEVSLIVPLYQRYEFLEHQLAQFVHDPEIAAADLIYVLDSPQDADHVRGLAEQLFQLYGVPFRLAVLSENGGFSAANNLGSSLSRGRLLLLLNSDVLPTHPGWLSALTAFHDSRPDAGAVAPKLLYEDDSIQHAGLYFERPPGAALWSNEHYFKGLHRDFPAANVARRVPAVSGACLMIEADLYASLGGLRGMFLRGDYEDSDLCLRLRELGREIWYAPEIELYHLEGQSYLSEERTMLSSYNRWLHTHLWNEAIEALAKRAGDVPV